MSRQCGPEKSCSSGFYASQMCCAHHALAGKSTLAGQLAHNTSLSSTVQKFCAHSAPALSSALQEAQQDSILSFERQLDEAMARDWATDKGRLLGAIAPYTGLGGTGMQGLAATAMVEAVVVVLLLLSLVMVVGGWPCMRIGFEGMSGVGCVALAASEPGNTPHRCITVWGRRTKLAVG